MFLQEYSKVVYMNREWNQLVHIRLIMVQVLYYFQGFTIDLNLAMQFTIHHVYVIWESLN